MHTDETDLHGFFLSVFIRLIRVHPWLKKFDGKGKVEEVGGGSAVSVAPIPTNSTHTPAPGQRGGG